MYGVEGGGHWSLVESRGMLAGKSFWARAAANETSSIPFFEMATSRAWLD